jgi:hypothetical protein
MKTLLTKSLKAAALLSTAVVMCVSAALVSSCEDEDDGNDQPQVEASLVVSPGAFSPAAEGGAQTVTVTANVAWTVTKTGDFLSLSAASGSNNGAFVITAAENAATVTRSGTVTVTGGGLVRTVGVTQAAAEPDASTLSVATPDLGSVPTAGATYTVAVTSNTAWAVTAAGFITAIPNSGAGDGTFTIAVAENAATVTRSGTFTVTAGALTETKTVTQLGAGVIPALAVAPTAVDADAAGTTTEITVTANVGWTVSVTPADDFITVSEAGGAGDGAFNIVVAENAATATRSGTVTVTSGELTETITVTQAAAAATLAVAPTAVDAAAAGTTTEITVTANVGWTVSVTPADDFITVSEAGGDGNGFFNITVAENATTVTRSGTVTVTSGELTEIITVTQTAAAATLAVAPTAVDADAAGTTTEITVTANVAWTVSVTPADGFITVSEADGDGDGAFNIEVAANSSVATRTGSVTVTSGELTRTITVTQAGVPVTVNATPATITVLCINEETQTITVTSNATWTVNTSAGFITLSKTAGIYNDTFEITVADNSNGALRTGFVTITSGAVTRTIAVLQAGDETLGGSDPFIMVGNVKWLKYDQVTAGVMPTKVVQGAQFAVADAATACPDGWRPPTRAEWFAALGTGEGSQWSLHSYTSPLATVNCVNGFYLNTTVLNGVTFNTHVFIPYDGTSTGLAASGAGNPLKVGPDNGAPNKYWLGSDGDGQSAASGQRVRCVQPPPEEPDGVAEVIEHGGAKWADRNLKAPGKFTYTNDVIGHDFVTELQHETNQAAFDAICPTGWHLPSKAEVEAAKANGIRHNSDSDVNAATEVILTDANNHELVLPICSRKSDSVAGAYSECDNGGGVYLGDAEDGYYGFVMFGWGTFGGDFGDADKSQGWQRYARCIQD